MSNLELLGVAQHQLARAPSSIVYPSAFSANARPVWTSMFTETLYSILRRKSIPEQWEMAVTEFLLQCKQKRIEAFPSEDSNLISRCVSLMSKQRKPLVDLIKNPKFLPQFKPGTFTQTVLLDRKGFAVKTVVQLKLRANEKADKASVGVSLMELGFASMHGEFKMHLTSTDYILVGYNSGWKLEFVVGVGFLPTTKTVNVTKYKKWLLDKVWNEAARKSRIFGRSLI